MTKLSLAIFIFLFRFVVPNLTSVCLNSLELSDPQRSLIILQHNLFRQRLSEGDDFLPRAFNMQALTYNCDLEISASVRAKTCQSVINETLSVGENSFIVDPKTDSNLLIDTALFAWWDQISNTKDNEYSHSKNISSFSNMAWATTIYVGCSVGQCEDRKLFVCHYHPKGNIPREKIYFEGKACKTNLHCLSINQGSCYNSLCTADDYPLSREGLNFDGRPFSSQPISSNIPTFQALLHQLTKSEADNTTTAFPEWESTSPQP